MFSTMTTAPSTTMPKSSAPSESRLAGMWRSRDRWRRRAERTGMVRATMSAPRTLPRNRNRMIDDEDDAFGQIVRARCGWCRWSRSLRSRKGTTFTPGGRMWSLSSSTLSWMPSRRGSGIGAFAQAERCLRRRRRVVDDLAIFAHESLCRSGPGGFWGPAATTCAISRTRIGGAVLGLETVCLDVVDVC